MAQNEQNSVSGENPVVKIHNTEVDWPAQIEYVKGLAEVVSQEGVSELEIEADGLKITLKSAVSTFVNIESAGVVSAAPAVSVQTSAATGSPKSAGTKSSAKSDEKFTPVVSPMVGVFYRAPSPSDPNFVEVGDSVTKGQTIGLVEAMKVFNEIVAETSGVVAKIPVETGALVETGQALVLLK
jgi:acetyl-CoA carboxylase biotin carboxyl carrier protein